MRSAATKRIMSAQAWRAACALNISSNQRHDAVNLQSLAAVNKMQQITKKRMVEGLENEDSLCVNAIADVPTLFLKAIKASQ